MNRVTEIGRIINDIYSNRRLIMKLSINDIKSKYAGAFLGILWAFVQPLVTILVFWFVFQLGFKNPPIENIQFILWFIAAYIPWIYFNDGVLSSSSCLYEYSYLVKKIKFRTSILPIVKIISATIIHLFFIVFIFIMFMLYGYRFSFVWLNCFYYSFALFVLMIGVSWIVSSISVFLKDFTQLISVIMQLLFWITPIFWSTEVMSQNILRVLKLNPIYYIINGYRSSLILGINFWERGPITLYYWCIVVVTFGIGAIIFKKLRPHFSDVL